MSDLLRDTSSDLYKINSDLTELAVDAAVQNGAKYADARVVERRHELISTQNDGLEPILIESDCGIGIRALYEFGWGFTSTGNLSRASIIRAGARAAKIAQANAPVVRRPMALSTVKPVRGHWVSCYQIDPFSIPLSDKADLLIATTAIMRESGCSSART
ncbi:MAG: PmbA/TldA family metallopeptidase, partial [Mycobacteriales bacterium]